MRGLPDTDPVRDEDLNVLHRAGVTGMLFVGIAGTDGNRKVVTEGSSLSDVLGTIKNLNYPCVYKKMEGKWSVCGTM